MQDKTTRKNNYIPNHICSNLSELDMRIIMSVPPGGNWKNIPLDVPSKRLEQIRVSFAAGKGSRSTYYGRLLPHMPSYTINTYFNRPGNGCHIHHEQDRVLTPREAARLQSFPDDFIFQGSQGSINTQIGNAVPPLLAYQVALEINKKIGGAGIFIDLFAGAGGLGLGFVWAGWQSIVANDIDSSFLKSYSKNVHEDVIVGSIADENIISLLTEIALKAKETYPDRPLFVLGGPPCQGFSTAGNKRTMEDERNHLFKYYTDFLRRIEPNGFIFENVAGLLNMEKGKVFDMVKDAFSSIMPNITGFVLNSEDYAIPQRRKRVFLVGLKAININIEPPQKLTSLIQPNSLHKCISVGDAFSDLPELGPGEDATYKGYQYAPRTEYQKLMRGLISHEEYLSCFR